MGDDTWEMTRAASEAQRQREIAARKLREERELLGRFSLPRLVAEIKQRIADIESRRDDAAGTIHECDSDLVAAKRALAELSQ